MSYACFSPYYGIPLSTGSSRRSEQLNDFIEREPEGLHTLYSGNADETPAAFGVQLNGGSDECCHHVEVFDIYVDPTEEEVAQFQALFEALSPEDQTMLKTTGEPRVFLLVSSS